MEGVHAVQAGDAVGAGLLLVGQDADGGIGGALGPDLGHQRRVSVHAVIVAVGTDHSAVQTDVAGLVGRHDLDLGAGEVALGDAVGLVQHAQDVELDALLGVLILDGQGRNDDVEVLGGNALGQRLGALLGTQMRQQIGDAEHGVVVLLTDADVDPGAVGAVDDTVQGQRDGGPLVLAHAAVVVGAQVADVGLFKHGHGAQVEARGVDVGNVQVEALLEVLRADGRGQHALFAVDGVDLGAGGVARAGHKLLIAGGGQQLFAVGRGLALGLGVVQEGLVALAEVLRGGNGIGGRVGYRFIFIEQIFQFLGGFHFENPF